MSASEAGGTGMRLIAGAALVAGLAAAVWASGCAGGGVGGVNGTVLTLLNDSDRAVEASVWAGDGLPADPNAALKEADAKTVTVPKGDLYRFGLPARTDGSASSVVAVVAVSEPGADKSTAQWLNVDWAPPRTVRVFGAGGVLRVARVNEAEESGKLERTVGPRPPSVGGANTPGPQR